jgi:hypothetical protein
MDKKAESRVKSNHMAARFSPKPELGNREFKTAEKLQHISVLLGLRCRRVSLKRE